MTAHKTITAGAGGLVAAGLLTTATLAVPAAAFAAPAPSVLRTADDNKADHAFLSTLYQSALAHKLAADLVNARPETPMSPDHVGMDMGGDAQSQTQVHARHFTDDSEKLAPKIKELAQKENLTLPVSASPADRAALDAAAKLQGIEFDRAVFAFQVAVVSREIKALGVARTSDKTSKAIKDFAKEQTPVYSLFFTHLRDMSTLVGINKPTLINTGLGGGAAPGGTRTELPAGVAVVMVLVGAGVAGGSLLTARRTGR